MTVIKRDVHVPECHPTTSVNTQEEADQLIVPHALEVVNEELGNEADFFTKDTDCWVLILIRLPLMWPNTRIITGTSAKQRSATHVWQVRSWKSFNPTWLPCRDWNWHNWTNKWCWMFMKVPPNIVAALGQLVSGGVPLEDVIERCDQFHCMLLSSKAISTAATLKWKKFSPNPGVDKLPSTIIQLPRIRALVL